MVSRARGIIGVVICVGLLAWLRVAAAQEATAILIVGVRQDGRPDARARVAVARRLLHMGEVALAPRLGAADLACAEEKCLQALAQRHKAGRLLGGDVQESGSDYRVGLWLYDAKTGRLRQGDPQGCEACDSARLAERLGEAAALLVEESPGSGGGGAAAPAVERIMLRRTRPSYWSPGRSAAVGVLGGLLLAGLGAGIGMAVLTGEKIGETSVAWSLNRHMTVTFAASGGLAAGLVVSLAWPRPRRDQ